MNNASKGRCVTVTPSGTQAGHFPVCLPKVNAIVAGSTKMCYHASLIIRAIPGAEMVPWSSG